MEVAGARFYYSRFSADEKAVYDGICDTLRQWGAMYGTSRSIHVDATKIMNGILCDNPEFFYVDRHHMMLKHNRFFLRIVDVHGKPSLCRGVPQSVYKRLFGAVAVDGRNRVFPYAHTRKRHEFVL